MQHLPGALSPMELHNSPLSEMACVGFEYGYSQEGPETLVLWEAQFGDFVNGAQVIIDQFITSGLAKWGQTSRLTLLLPHAYEGSGPEHSSARLERFLQLAAEGNIRVANLTTPAQYFHLLRRQARIAKQRPLVIMTPKSLLRLPQAASRLEDLIEGRFQPVLGEPTADPDQVTRLVLCTGKIYYDLLATKARDEAPASTWPSGASSCSTPSRRPRSSTSSRQYPNLQEVVWVQEEPRNMGARAYMSPRLLQVLPENLTSATSAVPSAPPRARAIPSPTPTSSTASSPPRSISSRPSRSSRASCPASGAARPPGFCGYRRTSTRLRRADWNALGRGDGVMALSSPQMPHVHPIPPSCR